MSNLFHPTRVTLHQMPSHPLTPLLGSIEDRAAGLPWAAERPWRRATHLGWDGGLPAVDLHDLSVRLALEVVRQLLEHPPPQGGWVVITGRGRHTGGRSRLRDAVEARLAEEAAAGALRFYPQGPGRFTVVYDEEAVRAARPGMGLLFWLFVALLLAGLALSIWNVIRG